MKLKIYQVDAFAEKIFSGNPAAVVPLKGWLSDGILQNIAAENNLSETAFYIKEPDQYIIRWFTPTAEVDLCGHATLATAHVLFTQEGHKSEQIKFFSPRSGMLTVTKKENQLIMDFPSDEVHEVELTAELEAGFGSRSTAAYKGKTDYMLVFEEESQIQNLEFDIPAIAKIKARGVIVTAKGDQVDFVSRFFGPQVGVNEDPVTGSAHTTLTQFWAKKLNKPRLTAAQLSPRKGHLICEIFGDRVLISGQSITYLIGEIQI